MLKKLMSNSDEEPASEISFVLLGSPQKTHLFEKLCEASTKYERHVHYQDVHYLTVQVGERTETVQVTDPGLARTGGREMAIRKADVAILFYSACSLHSLQQLRSLKDDLDRRKNLPIRLVCDLDDVTEDEEDGGSTGISSLSEGQNESNGYESDPEREQGLRRRPSMEKMRRTEDVNTTASMGREFATELGGSCVFLQLSSSRYTNAGDMLAEMVTAARGKTRRRSRSIVPELLKRRSKSRDAKVSPPLDKKDSASSTKEKKGSKNSKKASKSEPTSGVSEDGTPTRKNSQVKNSKVCSIM